VSKKKQSGKRWKPKPTNQLFSPDFEISLCGAGDLLNARFKVEDSMRKPGPIYFKDEKTEKICQMTVAPKIGPLMSSRKKAGNSAFCFFNNDEFAVKPGSLVTFVMGEFRKEHIPVGI
jgi:hypothetical protein